MAFLPGAVGGVFGAAGLAGVHGHADDSLDLVGGEEAAGGLCVRGGERENRADHVGLREVRCCRYGLFVMSFSSPSSQRSTFGSCAANSLMLARSWEVATMA